MRRLKVSFVLSAVINVACLLLNLLSYILTEHLLLAYKMSGGEIIEEIGFGLIASHIYLMTPGSGTIVSIRFSLIMFLISVLLFAALFWMILLIADKFRKKG